MHIKLPKPSVQDVPDEEPPVIKNPDAEWLLPEIKVPTDPATSAPDPVTTEEAPEQSESPDLAFIDLDHMETGDVLISWTPGETIIRVFDVEGTPPSADVPNLDPMLSTSIGRTTVWKSGKYSVGQPTWIRAKINPAMEMAQKEHAKQKTRTFDEMVPDTYHEFRDIFEKKASERFPESRPYDHAIDLKPEFIPRNCKIYPMSPKELEALNEFIDENSRKGYIRPSKSPMASPFFFVSKKDGSLRPCQDYRYLNEGTVKNAYPLPLISDLVEQLKGATVFSKFDLRSGYNNVRIKDGDQWKAAFKCARGLFEPTVMFFGLCNSPATFQNMMNELFADMIDEGWLVIYMDDMLIFSKDLDTHKERTHRLFQRLRENDLFLKPEKCLFEVDEVEFLGMIIRPDTVAMDPTKLDGIKDWPTPTTVKGVRSFLGFGNFYRRFISHYSDLARPLNDLTRKDQPWEWKEPQQQAFATLKERFAEAPVLIIPDKTKSFQVESDASKFATGAVLRQQDGNGDWHPCAYLSQSLNEAERNYQIYDRELLGIIRALTEWRHLLEGNMHPVDILSDHKNLTFFRTPQKLNRRQARWHLFLSQFDIQLRHVPGTKMIQSDTLSRLHHLNQETNDNDDITLLPDALFTNAMDLSETEHHILILPDNLFVNAMDITLAKRIRTYTSQDKGIPKTVADVHSKGPLLMRSALDDWKFEDGITYFKGRIYIPEDETLRRDIVRRYHDLPAAGHPGQYGTLASLKRDFYWPGMGVFVKNYVTRCAACQQMKPNTHPTVPPLMPIPVHAAAKPIEYINLDFITDLPESSGYSAIMVVADHDATKGAIFGTLYQICGRHGNC
ncbi:hypothetical protein EUX98_g8414 [Antrodiella citrinella]|uniref:Reverse transcriptase domain-containing protein n=1 Tax=Antrodiella citrinella TaxID=2447956 RepID=A0A4S4M982_9APHY|nr:hypothetical protein EUX98_g8414 [Antrodiella citrinella]